MLRGPHLTWAPSQALPGPSQHLHGKQQCTGAEVFFFFFPYFNEACFSNEEQQNPWCLLALGNRCLAPTPTPSLLFTTEAAIVEAVLTNGSDISTTLFVIHQLFFNRSPLVIENYPNPPSSQSNKSEMEPVNEQNFGLFSLSVLLNTLMVWKELPQEKCLISPKVKAYFIKRVLNLLGPTQSGPGQYPNYPQGQGQQYGAYRPPQPGPPQGQQQRPYGYDQVSMATTADSHQGSPLHLS